MRPAAAMRGGPCPLLRRMSKLILRMQEAQFSAGGRMTVPSSAPTPVPRSQAMAQAGNKTQWKAFGPEHRILTGPQARKTRCLAPPSGLIALGGAWAGPEPPW